MLKGVHSKRRGRRVSVKDGLVQYKTKGGLLALLKGSSDEYPILDISQRGLRFLTQDNLETGDKLSFALGIPFLGGQPLKVDGLVVWVQRSLRYKANVVGVRFTAITRDSLKRLLNLISFLGKKGIKVKQKVKVSFPEQLTQQPFLWRLARDFEVTINITEGLISEKAGWLTVEIEGEREEVRRVLIYLKQTGAKLVFPKKG